MSKTGLKRAGFIALVAVQALLLLGIVQTRNAWLSEGTKVLLRTVPVDPRSLFRGDYVRLNYEISRIDIDAMEADGDFIKGEDIYVVLKEGAFGVYEPASIWHVSPGEGKLFIKGRVGRKDPMHPKDIIVEDSEGRMRTFNKVNNPWTFQDNSIDKEFVLCLAHGGTIERAFPSENDYLKCPDSTKALRVVLREVRESGAIPVRVDYTIDSYFVEEGTGREIEKMRDRGEVLVEVALRDDGVPLISALIINGVRLQ